MNVKEIRLLGGKKGLLCDCEIANALGMTKYSFSRKINGKGYFSTKDIKAACAVFGISAKRAAEIFL